MRWTALPKRAGRPQGTFGVGCYSLINGLVSIGLMAAAALVTRQPLVFPSLGPTAFLLFFSPLEQGSSPRNTLCGHLVGVAAGYVSLVAFGLQHAPPALSQPGIDPARVGAAALSLGLTAGVMVWLHVPHAPAGATTLIVSLSILEKPEQLAVLMLAVLLLVAQALVINRLAGVAYPLWTIPRRGVDMTSD